MRGRIARSWAEAGKWYRLAEETTPAWLRLLLAGGIGAMAAVFFGWVDTHGEAIRIYLALVGVAVAGAASFVSGRVISEHADRRNVRRRANSASLRLSFDI
jgi:hypothetical protein